MLVVEDSPVISSPVEAAAPVVTDTDSFVSGKSTSMSASDSTGDTKDSLSSASFANTITTSNDVSSASSSDSVNTKCARSVSFYGVVIVGYTYNNEDYDRTPITVEPLTKSDIDVVRQMRRHMSYQSYIQYHQRYLQELRVNNDIAVKSTHHTAAKSHSHKIAAVSLVNTTYQSDPTTCFHVKRPNCHTAVVETPRMHYLHKIINSPYV